MNARTVAITALALLVFGCPVDGSAAPPTLLRLKLYVVKSGKLVPAAFAQLHISSDTAASRSTDAAGRLEIELEPGLHTVTVLMQKECQYPVTLAPKKTTEVSIKAPGGDATACEPVAASAASAATASGAASAASSASAAAHAGAASGSTAHK